MSDLSPPPVARRVAVVGAGPAGLYAAEELIRQGRHDVRVDVLDRLPAPYGLVRYGVAPDHPRIKSITGSLRKVLDDPRVAFHGGVELGTDVTRSELLDHYDAVVYAAGAAGDRRLGIPGEDLAGSCSARAFVSWYSGHPDAPAPLPLDMERLAVVGAGNVALDVARVLARPVADLERTDMPEPVLAALRASAVREIVVLARRGPQHARFTPKELRELGGLDGVDVIVDPRQLVLPEGAEPDRSTKANLRALAELAAAPLRGAPRRIELRFHARPRRVLGEHRVAGLMTERTHDGPDGASVGTGELDTLRVGAVLRAVGYRGLPLDTVPFDETRGVVPNDRGRVLDAKGALCPGEYVTGWLKRGPSGVIGTNKLDSAETVALLVDDLDRLPDRRLLDLEAMLIRRGVRPVGLSGWARIDSAERELGASRGRDRTKIADWPTLTRIGRSPHLVPAEPEELPWPS
ncbi:FAD-dependent oxidoreductase [Streptomyces sp. VNUA24]|uniref:FAD-dependent oxidoreductase n=1 Tax=Streptomyces sp. VNUA24 TaxID=3031131 RepID=UPI0023B7DB51|nr:FAD-dependent oxidoreductase [Streptomyces sp. VNUA24]WEH13023.1 FAD-dependent oxidoreductase [Streptomyces sp. VNUA24]